MLYLFLQRLFLVILLGWFLLLLDKSFQHFCCISPPNIVLEVHYCVGFTGFFDLDDFFPEFSIRCLCDVCVRTFVSYRTFSLAELSLLGVSVFQLMLVCAV